MDRFYGRAGALALCCGMLALAAAGQAKPKTNSNTHKKADKTAAAAQTYAVNVPSLGLAAGATRAQVLSALHGKIVAQTQFVGTYRTP